MPRITSVSGDANDNLLTGTRYDDYMFGHEGNDELHGLGGNDQLQGHDGDDRLYGGDGNDKLYGQAGSDLLDGGAGSDQLFGGGNLGGNDTFTGGSGADFFAWVAPWQGIDLATDFQTGVDKIDLARIDADERTAPGIITGKKTPGNEAFTIVSTTDGATPGHLLISTGTDELGRAVTIIHGFTNTAAGADFEIHLLGVGGTGGPIVSGADFIL